MGTGSGLPPGHLAPPSLGHKRLRVRAHAGALGKTIRSKPPNPGGFVAGYLSSHRGRGLAGELLLFFYSLFSNWAKARSQILLLLSLIDLRRTAWKVRVEAQQAAHSDKSEAGPNSQLSPIHYRHLSSVISFGMPPPRTELHTTGNRILCLDRGKGLQEEDTSRSPSHKSRGIKPASEITAQL
jgi:hypothetical protein